MYVLYWIDVPHFIFSVSETKDTWLFSEIFCYKIKSRKSKKGKFNVSNQYKSPDSLWYVMYWQAVLKLEATSGSAARNRYIELLHPRRIQSP